MSTPDSTLQLETRPVEGSRSTRRLRRTGKTPGIIYGGSDTPAPFQADARVLRNTLNKGGQILDVALDGGTTFPVLVKEAAKHPVRGDYVHVDLLRVDMKVAIQTTTTLELVGGEEAPGVLEGGVLDQPTLQLNIEALPGDLPETIQFDVSSLQINEAATLDQLTVPQGVTLLDDLETVIASITPPTAEPVDDEIETETELVGEEGELAAEGATAEEAAEGDEAPSGPTPEGS